MGRLSSAPHPLDRDSDGVPETQAVLCSDDSLHLEEIPRRAEIERGCYPSAACIAHPGSQS